jgi:hypothetical protein
VSFWGGDELSRLYKRGCASMTCLMFKMKIVIEKWATGMGVAARLVLHFFAGSLCFQYD